MSSYAPIHPERPVRRAAVAVAVSLAVHAVALVLLGLWALAVLSAARKAVEEQPKEVALSDLDAVRWEENRRVVDRFLPSAVAAAMPAEAARSADARFLSDRDRRVERETAAPPVPGMPGKPAPDGADRRSQQGAAAAAPAQGTSPQPPVPVPGTEGEGVRLAEKGPDLHARPIENRPLVMNFDVRGEGGMPEINGVAVGGLTVLNTEAWRYATFFDRVGETLYGVWRVEFVPRPPPPSLVARPRGGMVRVALGVTLDGSGRATTVTVRRSSGLADVDALLAELVQRSAPFPNVPPGLLDATGSYSDIWVIGLYWGGQAR